MTHYPWHSYLLLFNPQRIERHLDQLAEANHLTNIPNLWQIELGVLKMIHRMIFRPNSIGLGGERLPRKSLRARVVAWRPLRFPLLLWEGSVKPWDLSGFLSTDKDLICHLMGTHHEDNRFLYDFQLLTAFSGGFEQLRSQVAEIVKDPTSRRSQWLRDIVVYEGYHEALQQALDDFIADRSIVGDAEANDPDVSLWAYLNWCMTQPATPQQTWNEWVAGRWSLA